MSSTTVVSVEQKVEEGGTIEHPMVAEQMDLNEGHTGLCYYVVLFLSYILFLLFLPLSILLSIRVVKAYQRAILLRMGRVKKRNGSSILGPGVYFVHPCVDNMLKVDLRIRSVNIMPQEVLTRDSVTANVDAVVYMQVVDPEKALLKVDDANKAAELMAISILRKNLGTHVLTDLLIAREEIDAVMQRNLDEATYPFGIRVLRVEIKDVALPREMQRAMAAEAQETRAARAKVIAAQGELDASHSLQLAATRMSDSPNALQLRYLQTLTTIAAEKNSTVVFPLPIDLLNAFVSKKQD